MPFSMTGGRIIHRRSFIDRYVTRNRAKYSGGTSVGELEHGSDDFFESLSTGFTKKTSAELEVFGMCMNG